MNFSMNDMTYKDFCIFIALDSTRIRRQAQEFFLPSCGNILLYEIENCIT